MIHLYAIIDQPGIPLPALSGLDGAAPECASCRGIGAVVGPSDSATFSRRK